MRAKDIKGLTFPDKHRLFCGAPSIINSSGRTGYRLDLRLGQTGLGVGRGIRLSGKTTLGLALMRLIAARRDFLSKTSRCMPTAPSRDEAR